MLFRFNWLRLWLPIFLLWPLALLIAPFLMLLGLFTLQPIRSVVLFYGLLCALRGLRVQVEHPGQRIKIQII
ncbi:MAG: hypothetical protein ACXVB9_03510 [Bdellovibrionota bacterium]